MDERGGEERHKFRQSLSPDRRATMAVGAITLNWAQWDSEITHSIFSLRSLASAPGSLVKEQHVSGLHKTRLSMLRLIIAACCSNNGSEIRRFDRLLKQIADSTALRHKIAHGLCGLGNPGGTLDDLRLVMFLSANDSTKSGLQESGALEFPTVWSVFEAADVIWDTRVELHKLVRELIELHDPSASA